MTYRKALRAPSSVPGTVVVLLFVFLSQGCGNKGSVAPVDRQLAVTETERAFAKTMADRDLDAFRTFLSDEAVFLSGDSPLRGADAIVSAWAPFFDSTAAPFSWEPERVAVLASGTLAFSTGPVYNPDGDCIATFNSVWREEADGSWRIVFDRGTAACD